MMTTLMRTLSETMAGIDSAKQSAHHHTAIPHVRAYACIAGPGTAKRWNEKEGESFSSSFRNNQCECLYMLLLLSFLLMLIYPVFTSVFTSKYDCYARVPVRNRFGRNSINFSSRSGCVSRMETALVLRSAMDWPWRFLTASAIAAMASRPMTS